MTEPDRYRIFDLEDRPEKDFWKEVKRESELKHRDNYGWPDSFEEIRESDRYELEPVFYGETVENIIQFVRERTNRHWSKEDLLDKIEEEFSVKNEQTEADRE